MYNDRSVGVVVPAFNEELLISRTLASVPSFVDFIIVVDDGSRDQTPTIIESCAKSDPRIVSVRHQKNRGLGQALITGYLKALELEVDITSVMAGDNQMSPHDLETVIAPIAAGEAEYVKGNRLLHASVIERMPTHRFIGNSVLTLLTKFATGYWHSMDPQCGYTAISLEALSRIDISKMIKGYGYNAHILYMLNLENMVVSDVEIEPVYGEEKSKIKLWKYIPRVSLLLTSLFFKRLIKKYLVRDFHPLILFYGLSGAILSFLVLPLSIRFFYIYSQVGEAPSTTLTILLFSITNSLICLFFAMWMDMEDNKVLWKKRLSKSIHRPRDSAQKLSRTR